MNKITVHTKRLLLLIMILAIAWDWRTQKSGETFAHSLSAQTEIGFRECGIQSLPELGTASTVDRKLLARSAFVVDPLERLESAIKIQNFSLKSTLVTN